jgi:LysM repeat protein
LEQMQHRFIFFIWILIGVSKVYCQSKLTRVDYIQKYQLIAIDEMKRAGIPASITLAQGILESDNGNSILAIEANNHFGIKCHNDWTGKSFYYDDDKPNECFRSYKKAEDSYRDHSDFLSQHSRYAFLFELETTDYKNWAHGLKKAGYATQSKYDVLLIKIIEESELYKFDNKNYKPSKIAQKGKKQKPSTKEEEITINPFGNDVLTYNRIDYVIVKPGDTFESIAEHHGMRTWQIYKYNELAEDAKLIPGNRMYLQPKRRKAAIEDKCYTLLEGETMYDVSQKFGIKLKHLYRLNNMEFGTKPEPGVSLSLRNKKKVISK